MIVLHIQCRKDGNARMMLNRVDGDQTKVLVSRLITDENAQRVYGAVFAKQVVDQIAVRVFAATTLGSKGWVSPW